MPWHSLSLCHQQWLKQKCRNSHAAADTAEEATTDAWCSGHSMTYEVIFVPWVFWLRLRVQEYWLKLMIFVFLPVISSLQTFCVYLRFWFLIIQVFHLLKPEQGSNFIRNSEVISFQCRGTSQWSNILPSVTLPSWLSPRCRCGHFLDVAKALRCFPYSQMLVGAGMGKYRGNLQSISWFCCYNSDFQPLKLVLKMPLLVLKMPWPTTAMTPDWGSLVSCLAFYVQSWGLLSLLVSSIKTSVFLSVWVGQQWEGSLSHEGVTVNKGDFMGTVLRGVDHWLPVHPSAWDDCSGSRTFCEMQIIELYEFICLAELQNLGKYFCFEWIWNKEAKNKEKKKVEAFNFKISKSLYSLEFSHDFST